MRRTFFDKNIQKQFNRQGFVVVKDILSKNDIELLFNHYKRLHTNLKEPFFTSTYSTDKSYRKEADKIIKDILPERIKSYVDSYKPVYGNFMIKQPGVNSQSELHQDWTFSREDQYTTINIWFPLTSYEAGSGFIRFVKGSHKFNIPYRGRNIDSPISDIRELIKADYTIETQIAPGDAVFFSTRTIHCSEDNSSKNTRVAVTVIMIPEEADYVHYKGTDDGEITEYEVDEAFFTDYSVFEEPQDLKAIKSFPSPYVKMTKQDFLNQYKNASHQGFLSRLLSRK